MRAGKVVLLIVGALLGVVGLSLVAGGAFLAWAHATQRDDAGYYMSGAGAYATEAYAVTSGTFELVDDAAELRWLPDGLFGGVKVIADGETDQPIFIGIGPKSDVDSYLREVAITEVRDVTYAPFAVSYRPIAGDRPPESPGSRDFWVASAEGSGPQTLNPELAEGTYVMVLMNADGSAGVAADVRAGVKTDALLPVAIVTLVVGWIVALGGVLMIVAAVSSGSRPNEHGGGPVEGVPAAGVPPSERNPEAFPMRVRGDLQPDLSRWLWLVKWLLAFPHWILLAFLWLAFGLLTIVAGFAILFTGRYPRSIFDFNVGVLRWTWRVTFYAAVLGTDHYPPFSLDPNPSYPADLDVDYPERLSRGLVLVKWWLLAIPHYLIISLFSSAVIAWTWSWTSDHPGGLVINGGLIGIIVFIAAVILLFTGSYPRVIFDPVMGMERWIYRVISYAGLMRDEYPPFRLDVGGTDPGEPAGTPPLAPAPAEMSPAVGPRER